MNLKFRQFALIAIPLRTAVAQVSVGLLLLSAVVLMLVARQHADTFSDLRMAAVRAVDPVLMAAQQPVQMAESWYDNLQTVAVMQMENKALREELANLRQWHAEAVRLDAENRSLRALLQMKQPHEITSTAGSVLADNGTSYGHSVVVVLPEDFKLRRGLVAMTAGGMVGRTVDVAPGTGMARVLLLDDPASRIPVMLETAKTRGILAGQGNGGLRVEDLPDGAVPVVGDRIVTAGDDGVLPSGLPLARVTRIDGDRIWAVPIAQLDRLDWLRLVDFGTINTLAKPNFQAP